MSDTTTDHVIMIGDTGEERGRYSINDISPTQALVPGHLASMKLDLSTSDGDNSVITSGRSIRRRLSSGSIEGGEGNSEEMFSLQLEEDPVN